MGASAMTEEEKPLSTQDFDERLRRARGESGDPKHRTRSADDESGKAIAFRIGTELVVAVAVGGGIGYLLDNWLGTGPWLLMVFLLLGNVAGLWNIFRMTNKQGYAAGFKHDQASPAQIEDDKDEDNK
ncbi:MAG: AtpZ/AtpI family protein [Rhodospirillaceae bacterium]|jgi:ATP synthase protein I